MQSQSLILVKNDSGSQDCDCLQVLTSTVLTSTVKLEVLAKRYCRATEELGKLWLEYNVKGKEKLSLVDFSLGRFFRLSQSR